MTTTYHVEPQRSTGRGWVACPSHQAQRWAVIKTSYKGGASRIYSTVLTRTRSDLAHQELSILIQKPAPRRNALGQRFIRTGRKIIAGSRA